jgi:hypothetical protein
MTGQFKAADGAIGAPGISFNSEPASGLYRAGAADFRFSVASADVLKLGSQATLFLDGTAPLPGISFISDPDTGIYHIGANNVGFATNGILRVDIGATGTFTHAAPTSGILQ